MRPTRVEISVDAVLQNLQTLKAANGSAFFCPMIKANAYGHGVEILAQAIAKTSVDMAGVALLEEGVEIRRMGFHFPILSFAPLSPGDGEVLEAERITPVLGRFEDFDSLAKFTGPVHLKFNTGMQRLGFDREQIPELKRRLKALPQLQVAGLCTHMTHGEDILDDTGQSAHQFRLFLEMSTGFPGVKHAHKSSTLAICAGAGVKVHPTIGARPGISIYGLPHDGHRMAPGLTPALKWVSELCQIHRVEKGESASYSGRWTASRRSWIGVVPLGYGDGYLRSLSNKGQMLFRGEKVPVAGSVCMDYTLLDLTDACKDGDPKPGEEIVVMGHQGANEIRAADLADLAGTISYEITTAISRRVAREAV